jgi:hypothetical protein
MLGTCPAHIHKLQVLALQIFLDARRDASLHNEIDGLSTSRKRAFEVLNIESLLTCGSSEMRCPRTSVPVLTRLTRACDQNSVVDFG